VVEDQVGQQVTRLLSEQPQRLPIQLDPQLTKSIESKHQRETRDCINVSFSALAKYAR
jgi:hypothetical protein